MGVTGTRDNCTYSRELCHHRLRLDTFVKESNSDYNL